jgi:type IX secretion system PorP/SprF family membrane protein
MKQSIQHIIHYAGKRIFLGMLLMGILLTQVNAQDLHFSQYFNAPMLVNPANTGFAPDVDWRAGVNYRNQWATLTPFPYKTFSAWGDVQLFANRFENGWVGVGGAVSTDRAGSGNLSATRIQGSVAYHQVLGLASLISIGFQGGYVQKRVDPTKLTFDNQWNGKFFDVAQPNGEVFLNNNVGYFDLNVGLNYAYFPSENTYINAGIAVAHINQPSESFFSNSPDAKVPMRYTAFLNGTFKLNDQWIINPNVYYSQMARATETVLGINANYNLSGDGATQLIAGIYYRNADAIIPMVGYQWNDFKLTINYDATSSALSSFNGGQGAYEFSLVKTGVFSTGKSLKCPVVRF